MPLDTRIAFLQQDKMFLDRYHLRVRFGIDEHDRNMLASTCSNVIATHQRGELISPIALSALESDIAAFLAGGAAGRRANREARRLRDNARGGGEVYARNLAAAYHPHRENAP